MEPLELGLMGAGYIVNGIMQYYGMKRQEEENEKTRKFNRDLFNINLGWDREKFQRSLNFERKITEEKMKENKEDKRWNRQVAILGGLTSFLNSSEDIRARMNALWRR